LRVDSESPRARERLTFEERREELTSAVCFAHSLGNIRRRFAFRVKINAKVFYKFRGGDLGAKSRRGGITGTALTAMFPRLEGEVEGKISVKA